MTQTPNSLRLQIGIFGKTNSGKSSLLNAVANQNFSIVSKTPGTTADPVKKAMEIAGLGPALFIDTAGFLDKTSLEKKRTKKTWDALKRCDVVLAVFCAEDFSSEKSDAANSFWNFAEENSWIQKIFESKKIVIPVLTKIDLASAEKIKLASKKIKSVFKMPPVCVSAKTKSGIPNLIKKICEVSKNANGEIFLTGNLCGKGDEVLLVMPQDIQAPKGRLILPQVQILRELLDKKCVVTSCTADMLEPTLAALKNPPKLVITDSQVFSLVFEKKPAKSLLTSFSVLMAAAKGDINLFKAGADAISLLTNKSRVLIAEACTHVPQEEDIGRVKIPRMLCKIAKGIKIDFVRGVDFPENLQDENGRPLYDLIIHCGACMFNRTYVLQRQEAAKRAGIPMTNYGIAIAKMSGILEKVALP